MAYCHECGEQVAENDGFCPYCGITLQPIAVAGGKENDSQSDVFAVRQSEMTATAQSGEASVKTPPSPFDNSSATAANEILPENSNDNEFNDSSNDIAAANLNLPVELIETSTKFNSSENVPVENQTNRNPNGENQEELARPNFSQQIENIEGLSEAPIPKILETLQPIVESSESNATYAEGKLVETSAANVSSAAEIMEAEGINLEPVFVSTEGETVEDTVGADDSETQIEDDSASVSQTESSLMSYEEADVREVLSAEEPEKSVDEEIDRIQETATPAVAELPIAMPAIELPVADNCPSSRFDSVSIMEKKAEPVEPKPAPAIAAQTPAVEQKDERSFTTPNIGAGSDTDGKNKTKLKPLDEGTVLNGRYEIIRKIGGGGMGAVYLASDKNLGGVLRAVKEMVQSYIEDAQQEKAVNDFKRESLLLTSLDHQSIPTIYDYFFD